MSIELVQIKLLGNRMLTYGPVRVFVKDMEMIKRILIEEGFVDPSPFQIWKEGQVFGLIKRINENFEVHVRGYEDFTLDSEIELSREYIQHPYDCRPFYSLLLRILVKHGIRYTTTRPLPKDQFPKVPEYKVSWMEVIFAGVLLGIGIGLIWQALTHKKKRRR